MEHFGNHDGNDISNTESYYTCRSSQFGDLIKTKVHEQVFAARYIDVIEEYKPFLQEIYPCELGGMSETLTFWSLRISTSSFRETVL